jgi:hypothetical protein
MPSFNRRKDKERRSGQDRRSIGTSTYSGTERRGKKDRRSGVDRRKAAPIIL